MLTISEKETLYNFISSKLSLINIEQLYYTGIYQSCDYDDADYTLNKINDIAFSMGAKWGDCGCTKSVFYFEQHPDYVFKIPFFGKSELYFDDCDCCFYESSYVQNFEFAGDSNDNIWDYCETERRLYEQAVIRNVDKAFAGTFFIGMFYNYPIYVSEFRKPYNDSFCRNQKSLIAATSMCKEYQVGMLYTDVANIIDSFGEEFTNRLMSFIAEFNIDDFHQGNFGEDSNGNICIIDYSNYND